MRLNLTVTDETRKKLEKLAGSERRMGIAVDVLVAEAWKTHDPQFVEAKLMRRMDELNERLNKVFRMADASKMWHQIHDNTVAIDSLISAVTRLTQALLPEDEVEEDEVYD